MPISFFLGGSVAPILLMLSPLLVMAIGDCVDKKPTERSGQIAEKRTGDTGCSAPRLLLM